jgi:hypothetical protein
LNNILGTNDGILQTSSVIGESVNLNDFLSSLPMLYFAQGN